MIEALLDRDSPHYLFARTDLHLRSASTVYTGVRPETAGQRRRAALAR